MLHCYSDSNYIVIAFLYSEHVGEVLLSCHSELTHLIHSGKYCLLILHVFMQECGFGTKLGQTPGSQSSTWILACDIHSLSPNFTPHSIMWPRHYYQCTEHIHRGTAGESLEIW